MALLDVDVHGWNLTAVMITALAAGCGPAIVLSEEGDDSLDEGDGVTDDGVTDDGVDDSGLPPPVSCSDNAPCATGYYCDVGTGECIEEYDACGEYGCCDGGCCYDDYGGYDGCYYYDPECFDDLDCGAAELCETDYCDTLAQLPQCDAEQAPEFVPLPIDLSGDGEIVALAFVDANGDASEDLLVSRDSGASLYLGPGDAAPIALPVPTDTSVQDAVSGDFNSDGLPDIAAALGLDGLAIFVADGAGGFTLGLRVEDVGFAVDQVEAIDFDQDGSLDIAVSGSVVQVLMGDGAGGLLGTLALSDAPATALAMALPPDASASLLVAEGDSVREWNSGPNADDTFDAVPLTHPAVGHWLVLSAGAYETRGLLGVGVATGASVLQFRSEQAESRYATFRQVQSGATGDLRGDGRHDFVLLSDAELVYISHEPDGSAGCQQQYAPGGQPVGQLAVGDIDGDGTAELVTSTSGVATVYASQ